MGDEEHPDPTGKQLSVLKQHLLTVPDVELVWIDFSCMPQGERKAPSRWNLRGCSPTST